MPKLSFLLIALTSMALALLVGGYTRAAGIDQVPTGSVRHCETPASCRGTAELQGPAAQVPTELPATTGQGREPAPRPYAQVPTHNDTASGLNAFFASSADKEALSQEFPQCRSVFSGQSSQPGPGTPLCSCMQSIVSYYTGTCGDDCGYLGQYRAAASKACIAGPAGQEQPGIGFGSGPGAMSAPAGSPVQAAPQPGQLTQAQADKVKEQDCAYLKEQYNKSACDPSLDAETRQLRLSRVEATCGNLNGVQMGGGTPTVQLAQSLGSLRCRKVYQLRAEGTPAGGTFEWTTSDANVVGFSSGGIDDPVRSIFLGSVAPLFAAKCGTKETPQAKITVKYHAKGGCASPGLTSVGGDTNAAIKTIFVEVTTTDQDKDAITGKVGRYSVLIDEYEQHISKGKVEVLRKSQEAGTSTKEAIESSIGAAKDCAGAVATKVPSDVVECLWNGKEAVDAIGDASSAIIELQQAVKAVQADITASKKLVARERTYIESLKDQDPEAAAAIKREEEVHRMAEELIQELRRTAQIVAQEKDLRQQKAKIQDAHKSIQYNMKSICAQAVSGSEAYTMLDCDRFKLTLP